MKFINYTILCLIFVISSVVVYLFTAENIVTIIAAIPAAGALLGIVLSIVRDNISLTRRREENDRSEYYKLGVASGMSELIFKKHVDFCEAYIGKTMEVIQNMIRKGPHEDALEYAQELRLVRIKYLTWITDDMATLLMPFEQAIREIGANQWHLKNLPVGPERSALVNELYKTFSGVMEMGSESERIETIGHTKIIYELQKVLGINELHKMRKAIISGFIK